MPLASNPLRLPMLYLVLCVLLTGALAQRSPAPRAADRYPSCSTGTTGIQFVGIGNATGNGTCSWAAEGDTFWFIECINSWTVTADRCTLTIAPRQATITTNNCPCWWFGLGFRGNLTSATTADLTQVVPQSDVNTLLSRIQWAANNAETYNACFDDPDQLSDSGLDTVKLYRLQGILGSLTSRLQAAGLLGGANVDTEQLGAAIQSVAAGQRSMTRRGNNVYMRVGGCEFKFALLDNNNLLSP